MRKYLLGVLAIAIAGTGSAPAGAISDRPECEVEALYDGGRYAVAEIAAVIPLTAGTDTTKYPVVADVTCSIVVDGTVDVAITQRATGVAVIGDEREFLFSPTGFKICTTIDYVSNANDTDHWCRTHEWGEPTDPVYWATMQVDPAVCPVLQGLAPQTSPGDDVYITPEGDVYVLGVLAWDCPPYEPPA